MSYEQKVLHKGSRVRVVTTLAQEVAAKFAGFRPADELTVDEVEYRDLQEQAKNVGIPANQSKDVLFEALTKPADTPSDDDPLF